MSQFARKLVRVTKYSLLGVTALPPVGLGTKCLVSSGLSDIITSPGCWYVGVANEEQRRCCQDIARSLPTVVQGGVTRFSRSLLTGLAISLDYKYSLWGLEESGEEYEDTISQVHSRSAERILSTCLKNGGLYIKFGQGMCTHGILPGEFSKVLVVLQDQALRREGQQEIEEMFEQDFGRRRNEMFEQFSDEPIAAASLAQVFKGRTADGQEVAVKVQYRDLQDKFESDTATMESVLDLIQIFHSKFAFKWLFKETKGRLQNELNFEAEASNSVRCSEELRHLPYLYVPEVLENYSSKRILTTEFIDGIKVSDKEALENAGLDLVSIDRNILNIFSEQLFHTGFIHADPHPGNILIRPNTGKLNCQVVLLDHGLYEEINDDVREALAGLWLGIVNNDHQEMESCCRKLNVEDYRVFSIALSQRFISSPPGTEDELDFSKMFGGKKFNRKIFRSLPEERKQEIRAIIQSFHDRMFDTFQSMPPKMVLVMRNLNTIRGLISAHQTGLDRFRLMARTAVTGKFSGGFRGVLAKINFEMRLLWDFLKMYSLSLGLSLVKKLGIETFDHPEL